MYLAGWLWGCNSSEAPECFRTAGDVVEKTMEIPPFNSLLINDEFTIVISKSTEQHVLLSAPENLIAEINLEVSEGVLTISNLVGCRWVREYDFPTIHIATPDLNYIELTGGSTVLSEGTVSFNSLGFRSIDSNSKVDMSVACSTLAINSNEITNYTFRGTTDELTIFISSGDGRIDVAELTTNQASVMHRSSNDIVVNVTNSLTGNIESLGDLIYVSQEPASIDVTETNRGRLINGVD